MAAREPAHASFTTLEGDVLPSPLQILTEYHFSPECRRAEQQPEDCGLAFARQRAPFVPSGLNANQLKVVACATTCCTVVAPGWRG